MLNYQTERGLEAWAVVPVGLDVYYDWLMKVRPGFDVTSTLFAADVDIEAHRQAIRRIMMPLTRAVHTLVIEVRDPQSEFAHYLRTATDVFGDQITWMRGSATLQHLPLDGRSDGRAPEDEHEVRLAEDQVGDRPAAGKGKHMESTLSDVIVSPQSDSHGQPSPAAGLAAIDASNSFAAETGRSPTPFRTAYAGAYYEFKGVRWTDLTGMTPPLSVVQYLNQQYEAAMVAHDEAIDSADALTDIARDAYKAGQLTRALRRARRALEISPSHAGRAATVVAVLRKAKRFEEAMAILRQFKGTQYEPLVVTGAALLCDTDRWELAAGVLKRVLNGAASGEALAVRGRIAAARPDLYQS